MKNNEVMEDILKSVMKYRTDLTEIDNKIRKIEREIRDVIPTNNRSAQKLQTRAARSQLAWLNRQKLKIKRPVSRGAELAAKSWLAGADEPYLYSIGPTWVDEFLDTMKQAGMKKLFYEGKGPNGFECLMDFTDRGCEISEVCKVKTLTGDEIRGVRLTIK